MPILFDPREETFAQLVVQGFDAKAARRQAQLTKGRSCKVLLETLRIQNRIQELLKRQAERAELTRQEVLDKIIIEGQLASKVGQHSAALKALEMYGKEQHKMFVERKEIGHAGEFDNKSEQELTDYIINTLKSLGISPAEFMGAKLIEDGSDGGTIN
jgi:hypothetical protein